MFKDSLLSTPMTSEEADAVFSGKIWGDSFIGDNTFVATLRCILGNTGWGGATPSGRMGVGDTLSFRIRDMNATAERVKGGYDFVEEIGADIYADNTLTLVNLGCHKDYEDVFKILEEKFVTRYTDYVYAPKPTIFYKKGFPCYCYVDSEQRRSVVVVNSINMQKFHFLQTAIIAYLPWYFPKESGISEDEMRLIECLKSKDKTRDDYIAACRIFAERYDFRGAKIRKMLSGFEKKYIRVEIESLKRKIEDDSEYISEYIKAINDRRRERDLHIAQSEGLLNKLNGSDEENIMMDYFIANKGLNVLDIEDDSIVFGVKGPLEFFDEDKAEVYINNDSSILYRCYGRDYFTRAGGIDNLRRLWTAVFIDRTVKINMCAAYRLYMRGSVEGLKRYSFGSDYDGYFPNPHIDQYRCLGGNETMIEDFLNKLDYVGAIQQCMVSGKNLNFSDATVMQEFMERITGTGGYAVNRRCFEFPDGVVLNLEDAAKRLSKESEEAEAAKEEKEE